MIHTASGYSERLGIKMVPIKTFHDIYHIVHKIKYVLWSHMIKFLEIVLKLRILALSQTWPKKAHIWDSYNSLI